MKQHATKTALSSALLMAVVILMTWPPVVRADELSNSITASEQELSTMRGGFVTNDGFLVSFGIERAIYVNGILSTANSFSVSRTDGSSGLQNLASGFSGVNDVKVVQIGPAGSNIFSPAKTAGSILPGGFTVIQNSLDHQFVKNTMTLNASVTNMNLFKDMNLTSAIRQQMINAIR